MSYSKLTSYYRLAKNFGQRDGYTIKGFAIHCFVGQVTARSGVDYFAETDRDASANYVIGYDGKIGCSVDDEYRAYTTSNGIDRQLITIEVASDTTHPYKTTPEAYASLIDLLVDRCRAYGIRKLMWREDKDAAIRWDLSQQNMVVHRWFDAKACPGDFLYSLHYAIAEEVNKRLNSGDIPEPEPTPEPTPVPTPEPEVEYSNLKIMTIGIGDEGNLVKSLQGILQANGFDLAYCGGCDGIFGEGTEYAVRGYQRIHGLDIDGIVGQETWGSMLSN